MYEGFEPGKPIEFILPARFDAAALLPAELANKVDHLNYIVHVILVNEDRGLLLDFHRIDEVVGSKRLRKRLFRLLTDHGVIEQMPADDFCQHVRQERRRQMVEVA